MAGRIAAIRNLAFLVVAAFLAFAAATLAQQPETKTVPKVKSVGATPIQSIDGRDNFVAYCAVCHGEDGRGNGPAAPAMKAPVPDLTRIAQRRGGKFSAVDIEQTIRGTGKTATPAHGVEEMPIWGNVFLYEDRARSTLRITNMVKYIQSIQAGAQ
jgi:mono/diheme cytochrome c family protein